MTADIETGAHAVAPETADVLAVTEEVWRSFLGESEPLLPGPPSDRADAVTGAVTVTGGWDGAVTVTFTPEGAAAAACAMLGLDPTDVPSPGDVADAVGELVNMVGGNVKSLMPGPSTLSLPVVAGGRVTPASEDREVVRLDLTWTGHPVTISVHTKGSR